MVLDDKAAKALISSTALSLRGKDISAMTDVRFAYGRDAATDQHARLFLTDASPAMHG
ncbi:hypothetical protein [Pseudomonas japonica]|uniref:hypothetical protein n=1 Tax=Pseudomonas japonica TaxID=256466 RepID=UPI003A8C027F